MGFSGLVVGIGLRFLGLGGGISVSFLDLGLDLCVDLGADSVVSMLSSCCLEYFLSHV